MVNYKNYQQVLDLTVGPKSYRGEAVNKVAKNANRRRHSNVCSLRKRTRTGCLTCRRRKKKCDEERVGGKCQACARNFLECSWPHPESPVNSKKDKTSKSVASTPKEHEKPLFNVYPSPVLTPVTDDMHEISDGDKSPYIPQSPLLELESDRNSIVEDCSDLNNLKEPKFIITSFDCDNELYQIPSSKILAT
ncbi:uncharacterized protein PRCAT00000128001 [Priceomyces carsonii]|uniref:uncharacterized protein n=1 Tax=Priceomyces carsonii TaxID=28549 RepID=UPI002ED8DD71|nr:unnamed protein product [Priceomyces carsonii]